MLGTNVVGCYHMSENMQYDIIGLQLLHLSSSAQTMKTVSVGRTEQDRKVQTKSALLGMYML